MNYRHSYHAGNFADVVKHCLLALILGHLVKKETAFRYLDTHAGVGVYDLEAEEPNRTGEWRQGAGLMWEAALPKDAAALIAPWKAAVESVNTGGLRFYPGSPEIARFLTRAQDRLTFCELHPEDVSQLRRRYARDKRISVVEINGYTALNAYVPPNERRGLVLVDPPFEEANEFRRMTEALTKAHAKWPTGIYAFWYPIKDALEAQAFTRALGKTGIPSILSAELLVRRPNDATRLNGCGMAIVSPPWTLEKDLAVLLPVLAQVLGQDSGARGRVIEIAGEA